MDISWILSRLDLLAVADILIVTFLFYWILVLIQGTRAVQLLRGVILLVIITVGVSSFFRMPALNWLIKNSIPALLVAIPVIFQPELRRALEQLGRTGGINLPAAADITDTVQEIVAACVRLSERKEGALIVIERGIGLGEYIDTGVPLDARVTRDLLLTIFFPNTPLHDLAVVVRADRIVAAGCMLPLSDNSPDPQLGSRHRAALGISEETDAIAIIVSEETGTISVTDNGRIVRRLDGKRLQRVLLALYRPSGQPPIARLRNGFRRNGEPVESKPHA